MRLSKKGCGLPQRIFCPLSADKIHVCRPSSVFSDAHVVRKNGFDLFRACGRELCEAFSSRRI
jgi:hypothetical protein